ncbi:hypothetical protein Vretimale_8405 [Volvox reticuliferus]|uniref:Uncharacterized protein n=1 Tax=Volvox reticuliferus TaxID=1737510 RepID=A0A8J4LN89_9CHLO|nr:hypothetical protein Vretimale_8405 [Volvox reticuliferus]
MSSSNNKNSSSNNNKNSISNNNKNSISNNKSSISNNNKNSSSSSSAFPRDHGERQGAGASTSAPSRMSIPHAGTPSSATVPSSRGVGSIPMPDRRSDGSGGGGGGSDDGAGDFLRCFDGHKNVMTIKEVAFFGGSGYGPSYVVSGSDDGHVFMWDYDTAEIVRMLPVQEHAIPNFLAVHPSESLIAASGHGGLVKVWAPGAAKGCASRGEAEEDGVRQEDVRGERLRALVAANRADLRRRQADAEAEMAAAGGGRPPVTGWATFAAVSGLASGFCSTEPHLLSSSFHRVTFPIPSGHPRSHRGHNGGEWDPGSCPYGVRR